MSSIFTSILSSTVGLLWNKAKDNVADNLREGDVTDAKIREIIVRELSDIKTKLDGLSRKDLLSSYRYLKEGVDLLNDWLNKLQDGLSNVSITPSHVECGILSEALKLARGLQMLKIESSKEFEFAKERFKDARKKATEAFCNEALDIEDRIFAAKLRVVSEILEYLDSPETAITGCLSFLQDLHGLPAIREIFSVYLNGGLRSLFNKEEREDNVKSIMLINYVLFQFHYKFSSKISERLIWPGTSIALEDRSFNPILHWQEVSTRESAGEELTLPLNELVLDEEILDPHVSAINGNGEFVAKYSDDIKIFFRNGESKVVKLPEIIEGEVIEQYVKGLAVDNSNIVYVVKCVKTRTENDDVKSYVLYALDENYKVKHDCTLTFLEAIVDERIHIAVNNNNNIIMVKYNDPSVYVCDNIGQLKHKFESLSRRVHSVSISGKNEIMMPSDDEKAVHVYTERGDLISTITAPKGHEVLGVVHHPIVCKTVVLSFYCLDKNSCFLHTYNESPELDSSNFFCKRTYGGLPCIKSHPSGPVAVVRKGNVTFI